MNTLINKRILVGVSGGIAAYKSADLVRRLKQQGCDVRVMMTPSAKEFITSLTFQALSGHPVRVDAFDPAAEAGMSHIELARWADAVLIAPCSASTLSKLAYGAADNLLTTVCLATDAPMAIAPAMNRLMWSNKLTQANIARLKENGVKIFGPGIGEQACGEEGEGRMLEPVELVELTGTLFQHQALAGKKILVTAGPTREAIDPVRFISNHSSGKMGYAIAVAAAEAGAAVTLISGPVNLSSPEYIKRVDVETAVEMQKTVMKKVQSADIFISCAAVADYRVAKPSRKKIKKKDDEQHIALVKNPDILAEVAGLPDAPFSVGFAAETDNLAKHAKAKLKAKGVNMIAANQVGKKKGFNVDENELHVFWHGGEKIFSLTTKNKLARQLIELVAERYSSHSNKIKTSTDEKISSTKNS